MHLYDNIPPRKTNWFQKSELQETQGKVALFDQVKQIQGNDFWFELSRASRNQEFKTSGFYTVHSTHSYKFYDHSLTKGKPSGMMSKTLWDVAQ